MYLTFSSFIAIDFFCFLGYHYWFRVQSADKFIALVFVSFSYRLPPERFAERVPQFCWTYACRGSQIRLAPRGLRKKIDEYCISYSGNAWIDLCATSRQNFASGAGSRHFVTHARSPAVRCLRRSSDVDLLSTVMARSERQQHVSRAPLVIFLFSRIDGQWWGPHSKDEARLSRRGVCVPSSDVEASVVFQQRFRFIPPRKTCPSTFQTSTLDSTRHTHTKTQRRVCVKEKDVHRTQLAKSRRKRIYRHFRRCVFAACSLVRP
jgi:hypothetical protein